jgi:hypothetical protein
LSVMRKSKILLDDDQKNQFLAFIDCRGKWFVFGVGPTAHMSHLPSQIRGSYG